MIFLVCLSIKKSLFEISFSVHSFVKHSQTVGVTHNLKSDKCQANKNRLIQEILLRRRSPTPRLAGVTFYHRDCFFSGNEEIPQEFVDRFRGGFLHDASWRSWPFPTYSLKRYTSVKLSCRRLGSSLLSLHSRSPVFRRIIFLSSCLNTPVKFFVVFILAFNKNVSFTFHQRASVN